MPGVMKACLLTGHGGMERLQFRNDVPKPAPGSNEALVRVLACGLNNTDVNTRTGWYSAKVSESTTGEALADARHEDAAWGGKAISFPRIQGADVCGIVEKTGAGAPEELIGKRVLIDPWIRCWHRPEDREGIGYFGSETDGGFAEFTVVDYRQIHVVESEFSNSELATFATSWGTALYMLERVSVCERDTVLVTGASGGVGSALVQLARLRGARTVAMCSAGKAGEVAALGADVVIPRRLGEVRSVMASKGLTSVTVVADLVGGEIFPELLDVLEPQGRYVVSGAIGGPRVDLDLRSLYLRDLSFSGVSVPEPGAFGRLVGIIESGGIKPILAAEFPLSELAQAQAMFIEKKHVGNIVVVP